VSRWRAERASLVERIHAYVDGSLSGSSTEPFGALAVDVHRWQHRGDRVLAALTDAPVDRWRDVPAVPVALFKDLDVGTVAPGEEAIVFRTSGTTTGRRGVHRLRSTELYDHGALAWARRCTPGAPSEVVALLEDPTEAPDSSLSHMVALFTGLSDPAGQATWHIHNGRLDRDGLSRRLSRAGRPLYVASTAFALGEYLDGPVEPLPSGSVLMVTGGFKGRRHRLDPDGLHQEATARLQPGRYVLEYGMTELSSQLWSVAGEPYAPPPWLEVVAVDPATGHPLSAGEVGQLRFYDLCNLDSTLAVETMDQGVVHGDGRVSLHGRLAGAEVRGCSLSVEDGWSGGEPRAGTR